MNQMDTQTMEVPANEPQPSAGVSASGAVDLEAIRSKMNIAPEIQDIYDKCIFNGRRIMFDQETFGETSKYLDGPEPMAQKIANGVVAVVMIMWKKSNETLNPKVIVPVTLGLTLDAFEFLQKAGNKEATKQVLGEATDLATTTIMEKFGVSQDQLGSLVQQNQAAVDQPEQPGILGAA